MRMQAETWRSEIKVGDNLDIYAKVDAMSQIHGWI